MKLNKMREEIADYFIAGLKKNTLPWRQDWSSVPVLPVSAVTGIPYKGLNSFWLHVVSSEKNYKDPRWCTFKQANDNGWRIRKGENGTKIEFWSLYDRETKKTLSYEQVKLLERTLSKEAYQNRLLPVSKVYIVFNAEQIEGIPELAIEHYLLDEASIVAIRSRLLSGMNVGFVEGEEQAYYASSKDEIHMPDINRFRSEYSYLATFFHEASHATGHKSRLNRDMTGGFGSETYAKEELRAEVSSAFTAQAVGISQQNMEHLENHSAYIKAWISILENNPNELFTAIKDAEKISGYLLEKGELNPEKKNRLFQSKPDTPKKKTGRCR